jgi:hypothetical protein
VVFDRTPLSPYYWGKVIGRRRSTHTNYNNRGGRSNSNSDYEEEEDDGMFGGIGVGGDGYLPRQHRRRG